MTKGEDLAFPFKNPANDEGHSGLTKREYFAALAMQGLLSHNCEHFKDEDLEETGVANRAVKLANALIEALNKKENEG